MRQSEIVLVGVAVAVAIGLSASLASASIWGGGYPGARPYLPGQQQYGGFPAGGMMGTYGYRGMMGGYYGGATYGMGAYCSGQCPMNYSHSYGWNYSSSSSPVIHMVNSAFVPSDITVQRGTTVTWVNTDLVPHTVTSGSEQAPTGLFDSHELVHMQTFSYTFNIPGVYAYYCDLHAGMTGTITVTD